MRKIPWWRAAERQSADERAAIDALRERARALPREAQPRRDLWSGIRNRIELRSAEPERARVWRARVQVPVWAAGAAALVLFAASIGTGLWLRRPPSLDDPAAVRALADSLRDRDGTSATHEDLLTLLNQRRAQLPPEVVAAIEKNLGEIDRAIAEIHIAFEQHPDNAALQFLLAEAYHREADMLEQLQWWTSGREPEAHS
jgi:hypothetical protein